MTLNDVWNSLRFQFIYFLIEFIDTQAQMKIKKIPTISEILKNLKKEIL